MPRHYMFSGIKDSRRSNSRHQDLCRVSARPGPSGHSPEPLASGPSGQPRTSDPRHSSTACVALTLGLHRNPHGTSGARTFRPCPELPACLRAESLGRGPCTCFAPHLPLRGPRLYILLHLLLVRISVVMAHLTDRASLIHIGSTP